MYWDRSVGEIRPWDEREIFLKWIEFQIIATSIAFILHIKQAFFFCNIYFHMYICGKCKFTLEQ